MWELYVNINESYLTFGSCFDTLSVKGALDPVRVVGEIQGQEVGRNADEAAYSPTLLGKLYLEVVAKPLLATFRTNHNFKFD